LYWTVNTVENPGQLFPPIVGVPSLGTTGNPAYWLYMSMLIQYAMVDDNESLVNCEAICQY
jgi:hypothetical protein